MTDAIQKAREALELVIGSLKFDREDQVSIEVMRRVNAALAALDAETEVKANLTRPIIGIENRTAQEAFDIMCDRIRSALAPPESRS